MEDEEQSGRPEFNLSPEAIANIHEALNRLIVPIDTTAMINNVSAGLLAMQPVLKESQRQSLASSMAIAESVAKIHLPDMSRLNDSIAAVLSTMDPAPFRRLNEIIRNFPFPQIDTTNLSSLLENAYAFEQEYGGTEVEEAANEFLESNAIIAEQVYGSPFLRTLTLRQRRMVAGYLAFLVYLVFVSVVIFGDSEYPEIMHTLELFGIKLAPLAAGAAVYGSSKKIMDKTMAAPEGS